MGCIGALELVFTCGSVGNHIELVWSLGQIMVLLQVQVLCPDFVFSLVSRLNEMSFLRVHVLQRTVPRRAVLKTTCVEPFHLSNTQ